MFFKQFYKSCLMLVCISKLFIAISSENVDDKWSNWKKYNFLECKASIKKNGWFKYTKNPIKGMGLMKHKFQLVMRNNEKADIYNSDEFVRTHEWEFDIPKEKFPLI